MTVAETILLIAPELNTHKDDITAWISMAEPYVSKKQYGKLYDQALANLTAHMMTMAGLGDDTYGAAGETMRLASVSEGNTSVSFNTSLIDPTKADAELNATKYGMQYRRIRSMCIFPAVNAGVLYGGA